MARWSSAQAAGKFAQSWLKAVWITPSAPGVARFVVAAFRADAARAGAEAEVAALVEELSRRSPEFAAMWREGDVRRCGEGVKRLRHPVAGEIAFEYPAFAVDGRPDLGMVVYTPATPEGAARARGLIEGDGR